MLPGGEAIGGLSGSLRCSPLLTLLIARFLTWLPHGIIGFGFTVAGSIEPSVQLYLQWASKWPGLPQLSASAPILVAHFGLSLLGFALAGRALWRDKRLDPLAGDGGAAD